MSEHHRTKQIQIRLVKYYSAEISDPSEVPSDKLVIGRFFSKKVFNELDLCS